MTLYRGVRAFAACGLIAAAMLPAWGCKSTEKAESKPAEPARAQEQPKQQDTRGVAYRPNVGAGMTVTSLAFPTGETASSALLVHQVAPTQVRAGQTYSQEIHVTNLTGGTLQSVVVSQEGVNNFAVSGSDPQGSRAADGSTQWSLGDLGPRQTKVIKVTGVSAKTGTASACVSATYATSLCIATQVVEPALALTKTATQEALACDTIQIKYEVKNPGSGVADGVHIKDTLASGMTTSDGKTSVDIDAGTLASGQSKQFTVMAKAAKPGKYESPATATATGGLTAQAAATTTVVRQPVLAIAAKCPERTFIGRTVRWEFTVSNTGDAAAPDTVVTSRLPAGVAFDGAADGGTMAGGVVTWRVGALAPSASKTVTMSLRPTDASTVRAGASATANCAATVTADCQTAIVGIPAILLEVVDIDDPIEVGKNQTYVITVTNQGSAPDSNIVVTAEFPPEQEFVSAGGATKGSVAGNTVTFAPLATLAPKAAAEFRMVVKAKAEGNLRVKFSMTSDQFKVPVTETEATNQYK